MCLMLFSLKYKLFSHQTSRKPVLPWLLFYIATDKSAFGKAKDRVTRIKLKMYKMSNKDRDYFLKRNDSKIMFHSYFDILCILLSLHFVRKLQLSENIPKEKNCKRKIRDQYFHLSLDHLQLYKEIPCLNQASSWDQNQQPPSVSDLTRYFYLYLCLIDIFQNRNLMSL